MTTPGAARRVKSAAAAALLVLLAVPMRTPVAQPMKAVPATIRSAPTSLVGLPAISIYGDSLTVAALDAVTTRLEHSVELTIHAYPGTDLAVWHDDVVSAQPSRLVLALGTNDADHSGVGPWRTVLSELSSSTCVVWPRPYRSNADVSAFDDGMDALLTDFRNVHVVDWGSRVDAHPAWLLPDGVHYRPDGVAAYASMLIDAADTCLT